MATYAIGDVQGCFDSLRRLLDELKFDSAGDRLWFAGDLVNRGPQSAELLRFVRDLGDSAKTVLGNHDLHLLAVSAGRRKGRRDTFKDVLDADDREELLDWLRSRPLMVESKDMMVAMLHAGLPPQWTLAQASRCAREAEANLRSNDYRDWLEVMYGNNPDRWDESLQGEDRFRFTINCFTRLRYCDEEGRLAADPKGTPGTQADYLMPWFAVPGRRSAGTTILFGHWSTLGQVHWPEYKVYGLDCGCVWGGKLAALRLEDGKVFKQDCKQYRSIEVVGD